VSSVELPRTFGPYVLLEEIGKGGSGSAYLALPIDAEVRPIIVKRLHPAYASDQVVSARLRHEAAIAVSVDSPHVVRVENVGTVAGEPFIAMERVPGSTIARLMQALSSADASLPLPAVASLLADGLFGLEALHSAVHPTTREPLDVVHRDIAPKNLIVTPEARLVLIDLGLGKSNLRDWATKTGTLHGTPGYVSPEHASGERVDQRADLYALAVVGFELLTKAPYIARADKVAMIVDAMRGAFRPPSTHRSDVSAALDRFFERALAIAPGDRFASAREMREALASAVGGSIAPFDPALLPETFRQEIAGGEQRLRDLLAQATEPTAIEAATEIWVRRTRSAITEPIAIADTIVLDPRARQRSPLVRARLVVLAFIAVAALSAALANRFLRETATSAPSTRAIMIEPSTPKANPAAPSTPELDIRSPSGEPGDVELATEPAQSTEKSVRARAATKAPAAKARPPDGSAEPDFQSLIRDAAALARERPDLASDLEALITDATMWRRADVSPRTRSAWERLRTQLEALRARPR
jgi:eukaryotic-like serine/threonine-protein kinase